MKRLLTITLSLLALSTIASAQVVRSGVVRRTTNRVQVEEQTAPEESVASDAVYQHEIGTYTHSVSAVFGWDEYGDELVGVDYTVQYRFSPLLSAGGGIWAGWWWPFGILSIGHFGFEPRVNIRIHPLAESHPNSPFQPYASLNLGTLLPPFEVDGGNYGYGVDSWAILTGEIGCDWYRKGRTLFASININSFHEYEWEVGEYSYNNDWNILSLMFKIGVRF